MRSSILTLVTLLVANQANAGMLGDAVRAEYLLPSLASTVFSQDVVVDAGVEITSGSVLTAPWTLDFGDSSISFRQGPLYGSVGYLSVGFNGWLFSSLDLGAPITGFNLTSFGISGLDSSRVSFTSDSMRINLQGFSVSSLSGWDLEILTRGTAVPEPGTLALLGLGLAGLGLSRRRRAN